MGKNNFSAGIVLVSIAVILVLGKLGVFTFLAATLWPLLLLGAGLLLHTWYFRGRAPDTVLIPAGMLLTFSLIFLICTIFAWDALLYLWPGFLFGVGVGLYERSFFSRGRSARSDYTAAFGIAVVSVVLFVMNILSFGLFVLVGLLLVAAAFLLLRGRRY